MATASGLPPATCILGLPGAGKTYLAARLAAATPGSVVRLDHRSPGHEIDRETLEQSGVTVERSDEERALATESLIVECDGTSFWSLPTRRPCHFLTVIDTINFPALSAESPSWGLAVQQVTQASAIVLSRTAHGKVDRTRTALGPLTDAPLFEETIPAAALQGLPAVLPDTTSASSPFTHWTYTGSAMLNEASLEAFVRNRPRGIARLKARIRGKTEGVSLDIAGRAVTTLPIARPDETMIAAWLTGGEADLRAMDTHFADTVAATSWMSGLFGYR